MGQLQDVGIIETRTATHQLLQNGLIYAKIHAGAEQTLDDAKENLDVATKMAGGKICPVLIDIRAMKSISSEAREYYAGDKASQVLLACALLIGNPISKLIGNFFLTLHKPRMPTRLFTDEETALEWLEGFLKK